MRAGGIDLDHRAAVRIALPGRVVDHVETHSAAGTQV